MRLQPPAHLYFVGIGGAGMSSLARFSKDTGFRVSGSDRRESPQTQKLAEIGATIFFTHAPENLHHTPVDALVVSSAVPPENPEVQAALQLGIPVLKRGEWLAQLVDAHPHGIAVCGTHGKGTTSGALVHILQTAGKRVSYILGAPLKTSGIAAQFTPNDELLVAEVDESDGTHLSHTPQHLLINNLEVDHLHTYDNLDSLVESFKNLLCKHFPNQDHPHGACIIGCHGAGIPPLLKAANIHGVKVTSCSTDPDTIPCNNSHVQARQLQQHPDGSISFSLWRDGEHLCDLKSPLKGPLNARNLTTAAALSLELGVSPPIIKLAIASYEGLIDRFDEVEVNNRLIITDYTSHPTCIRGNLEALRARKPNNLHAVFQPFRYSLLSHFWLEYIEALAIADHVHILPMDGAGEEPVEGINCHLLTAALQERSTHTQRYKNLSALEQNLALTLPPGSTLIVFGGGPLFGMARRLQKSW